MEKVRAHLKIKGQVQGVYFRAYMQEVAEKFGVTGWVKNCSDGSVETLLEGDKINVERVIDWAHEGPPAAQVYEVEVVWENYTGEFKNFKIKHY